MQIKIVPLLFKEGIGVVDEQRRIKEKGKRPLLLIIV